MVLSTTLGQNETHSIRLPASCGTSSTSVFNVRAASWHERSCGCHKNRLASSHAIADLVPLWHCDLSCAATFERLNGSLRGLVSLSPWTFTQHIQKLLGLGLRVLCVYVVLCSFSGNKGAMSALIERMHVPWQHALSEVLVPRAPTTS